MQQRRRGRAPAARASPSCGVGQARMARDYAPPVCVGEGLRTCESRTAPRTCGRCCPAAGCGARTAARPMRTTSSHASNGPPPRSGTHISSTSWRAAGGALVPADAPSPALPPAATAVCWPCLAWTRVAASEISANTISGTQTGGSSRLRAMPRRRQLSGLAPARRSSYLGPRIPVSISYAHNHLVKVPTARLRPALQRSSSVTDGTRATAPLSPGPYQRFPGHANRRTAPLSRAHGPLRSRATD